MLLVSSTGLTLGLASALAPGLAPGLAQTGALLADAPGAGPGGMFAGGNMLLLVVMFGIFYFLMIRPQQKRQRELQDWLKKLEKDAEVVTTGGLWGKVKGVSENSPYVTLELQEKVRVRVLRSHIAGAAPKNDQPAEPSKS